MNHNYGIELPVCPSVGPPIALGGPQENLRLIHSEHEPGTAETPGYLLNE